MKNRQLKHISYKTVKKHCRVLWCSGYHVCFTRRRSRVRTSPEPSLFIFCATEIMQRIGRILNNILYLTSKLTENNKEIEISKTNTQHLRIIHQKTILIVRWLQFKMNQSCVVPNLEKNQLRIYPQCSIKQVKKLTQIVQ